jgi:hypothetical protein
MVFLLFLQYNDKLSVCQIPGDITDYEFVDENDIAGFVSRYNECIKNNLK